MKPNETIEWVQGPFDLRAAISNKGEFIHLSEERRCGDVSADLAGGTAGAADRPDRASDPHAADLITPDGEFPPPVMGGQGRGNCAAFLSAVVAVVCLGGMGLIVAIAVAAAVVRFLLSL